MDWVFSQQYQASLDSLAIHFCFDDNVLAAAVRVDRAVEGQVRGIVAGDDGFRRFDAHLCALRDGRFLIPAVILGHRAIRREAVVRVGGGAAAARGNRNGHLSSC